MKFFIKSTLIAAGLVALFSCQKPRNYPVIPAITYKNFIIIDSTSANLQINFTDGDGDIGYASDYSNPPVNFYVEYLHDSAGHYVPALFSNNPPDPVMGDTLAFPYHIPYITPTGKDKSLSGQIQVHITPTWYLPGDKSIEYRIWLIDRAGHVSNRLTTPPIAVPF